MGKNVCVDRELGDVFGFLIEICESVYPLFCSNAVRNDFVTFAHPLDSKLERRAIGVEAKS